MSRTSDERGRPERPLLGAIGRAIRLARTARGWSQVELAERAGLSGPYVSQIETGAKRPSSESLLAVADALGIPAHELLAEAATPTFALDVRHATYDTERSMHASAPMPASAPPMPAAMSLRSESMPARTWRRSMASEAASAPAPPDPVDLAADRLTRMVRAYDEGSYRSISAEQLFLATSALRYLRSADPADTASILAFVTTTLGEQLDDFERWERAGSW